VKFPDEVPTEPVQHKEGTFGWIIQRVIDDIAAQPDIKQQGYSQLCTLRLVQRSPISKKIADKLLDQDFIDHAKERRKEVKGATVMQDITFIRGVLKYARSSWKDCRGLSAVLEELEAARPFLMKHGLIAKAAPRKRVPTDDEISRLIAYFTEHGKDRRTKIRMVPLILFALASSRRIGEICRMTHGDIEWDNKDEHGNPAPMYWIRDLKHPTKKKGNDKRFAMLEPMPEIIRMMPRLTNDPNERVFPFVAHSCSAKYTAAKRALGIVGLRFHDCRRESITRWLAVFKSPHTVKQISGHDTIQILERNYDASDPSLLHEEFARIVRQRAADDARSL
jgi:integrase